MFIQRMLLWYLMILTEEQQIYRKASQGRVNFSHTSISTSSSSFACPTLYLPSNFYNLWKYIFINDEELGQKMNIVGLIIFLWWQIKQLFSFDFRQINDNDFLLSGFYFDFMKSITWQINSWSFKNRDFNSIPASLFSKKFKLLAAKT